MARTKYAPVSSRAIIVLAQRDVLLAIEVLAQAARELRTISSRLRTAAQLASDKQTK